MMQNVFIREMREDDLEQVMALYKQPDMDDGEGLDIGAVVSLLEKIECYPFYRFYVACANGGQNGDKVVGVFGLLVMDNLGHMGAPSGIVEGVCVDPDLQGAGIGRQMMKFAMQICQEKGCYKMALTSNMKRARAHEFYNSLGFDQHGLSFQVPIDGG